MLPLCPLLITFQVAGVFHNMRQNTVAALRGQRSRSLLFQPVPRDDLARHLKAMGFESQGYVRMRDPETGELRPDSVGACCPSPCSFLC